jgi:hypothetical protein
MLIHKLKFLLIVSLFTSGCSVSADQHSSFKILKEQLILENSKDEGGDSTKKSKVDTKAIIDHFSRTPEKWDQFLGKIYQADLGAIILGFHIIEESPNPQRRELSYALQETMIQDPKVVVEGLVISGADLRWVCGTPARQGYEFITHLNNERIESIKIARRIWGEEWKKSNIEYYKTATECLKLLEREKELFLKKQYK